jgi:hypothetical protein
MSTYSALGAVRAVVDLGAVIDVKDVNCERVFLDAVDDPVGPPAGSVAAGQGPEQWFAYTVRVDRQCGIAELQDSRGHGLREALGDRTPRGGLEAYLIPLGRFAGSPAGGAAPGQILADGGQISTGLAAAQRRQAL